MRDGRTVLGEIETVRLGLWAGAMGGDSGHFLKTSRRPPNPYKPKYLTHGQAVMDDSRMSWPESPTRCNAASVKQSVARAQAAVAEVSALS